MLAENNHRNSYSSKKVNRAFFFRPHSVHPLSPFPFLLLHTAARYTAREPRASFLLPPAALAPCCLRALVGVCCVRGTAGPTGGGEIRDDGRLEERLCQRWTVIYRENICAAFCSIRNTLILEYFWNHLFTAYIWFFFQHFFVTRNNVHIMFIIPSPNKCKYAHVKNGRFL